MAGRRKALSLEALKRSRSSFHGAITKNRDKLLVIKEGDFAAVPVAEVKRILHSTSATAEKFKVNLEEASVFIEADPDAESLQAEDDEAAEAFEEATFEVTQLGEHLLLLNTISTRIATFNTQLQGVRDIFSESPEANQEGSLKRLRTFQNSILENWEKSGMPMDHPAREHLDRSLNHLTKLEAEMAGPKRERSPPALDTSYSSTASSLRELQQFTKIPERNLPKFNGNVMEFADFWQEFECRVGSKDYLAESEKMGYLQSCITDPDAKEMLYCPVHTPGMYQDLVKRLKKRYNRVTEIHRTLVNQIFRMDTARNNRQEMRRLTEKFTSTVQSIERTGYNQLGHIYSSLLYGYLPPEVKIKWDHHHSPSETVPDWKDMITYLEKHTEVLPAKPTVHGKTTPAEVRPPRHKSEKQRPAVHIGTSAPAASTPPRASPASHTYEAPVYKWECTLCAPEKHPLYVCSKWLTMTVPQRKKHAGTKKLCLNCLALGHETTKCWSRFTCKECGEKHHTTLHPAPATPVNAVHHEDVGDLLITSRVLLIGPDGKRRQARALLDTGAAMNILSSKMAEALKLPMNKAQLQFKRALGGGLASSNHTTEVTVSPLTPGERGLHIKAAVVEHVTDDMPVVRTAPASTFKHLEGLELADPSYHVPDRIDLILGLSAFLKLVQTDQLVEGPPGTPTAVRTIFGWGVGGALSQSSDCEMVIPIYTSTPSPVPPSDQDNLPKEFHQFWQGEELEGLPGADVSTDNLVEEHYSNHVAYSADKRRYTVTIPRRDDVPPLGDSRPQALARYLNQERALIKKGTYTAYQAVMKEYLDLHHAEQVPSETALPPQHFYLPMHAVVKETSTTTKLRVVFDGSALTSTGVSLNQTLLSGPTVQPTLTETLLRFRSYTVGVSADISKMYREVELAEEDRDLHRFLWREKIGDPVLDYRMTRVTFGINSSPWLAIRTLNQIAADHGSEDPEVQHHIRESFYVDDFLGGADSISEARELPGRIRAVLSEGGMNLCKWRSSHPEALQDLPPRLIETSKVKSVDKDKNVLSKTLGTEWDTEEDTMFPDLTLPATYSTTKRGLMSDISRLFDVLGWVSPTTLLMKINYQELWALNVGWDEQLPDHIKKKHYKWRSQLYILAKQRLSRPYYLGGEERVTTSLHGFADASMKAYGAVVYVRSTYQHHPPLIRLVMSKTKVAPRVKPTTTNKQPKGMTISRLELCGAHLLAKLLTKVMATLDISLEQVWAWTDSSCVLSWLDGNPRDYQVFVTNRVAQVLDVIPPQHWRHIPTGHNPADVASRGLYPAELASHQLWWDGPTLLAQEPIKVPPQPPRRPLAVPELRAVPLHAVAVDVEWDIEARCNVYLKLLHSAAWWIRFMDSLRKSEVLSPPGSRLTLAHLKRTEQVLIRRSQARSFPREVTSLQTTSACRAGSKLSHLCPYLDSDHILRVGGRLAHSALTSNQKYPIILNAADRFTKLYFQHLHLTLGHCGPSLLLCHTGLRYHVLGAKRLAKWVCNRCITCLKLQKSTRQQLMGQLPADRVTPCPPFYICGVDYAGPFKMRMGYVRRPIILEVYVTLFVCFTTRAIHLELVADQTTEAFLGALKRFIGRRSCPHIIYSDNGGNFVGARNDLMRLQKMLQTAAASGEFESFLLLHGITWKLSPAKAPHFGGLWEAGVKSMKHHLRRMLGEEKLTLDQLRTVLCQVEAMLNSRPLLPLDGHSTEGLSALTSGHFLVGRPLTAYPETPLEVEPHLLKSWNKVQGITQGIWVRWATEYVRALQSRQKWIRPEANLEVGDIVIIREVSPFKVRWPLARVIQTFPGKDGKVRAVKLQTATGTLERPTSVLALLTREGYESPEDLPPGRMFRPEEQPEEQRPPGPITPSSTPHTP